MTVSPYTSQAMHAMLRFVQKNMFFALPFPPKLLKQISNQDSTVFFKKQIHSLFMFPSCQHRRVGEEKFSSCSRE